MDYFFKFKLQLLEWILAIIVGIAFFQKGQNSNCFDKKTNNLSIELSIFLFFIVASVAKFLQFYTLGMNAQDFWLFVELLENLNHGQIGITHFAPHAFGPVQHEVIHPFVPWLMLAPLAKLFSSIGIAVVFGPFCFAIAAFYLNKIATYIFLLPQQRFLLLWAFLLSKQTSLTMMYDVHPESLYPLLSFGLIYEVINKKYLKSVCFALTLGILKADSFMVVWGVLVSLGFLGIEHLKKMRLMLLVIFSSGLGYLSQLALSKYFTLNPGIGMIPTSGPILGHRINGFGSLVIIAGEMIKTNGGVLGTFQQFFNFIISDSWRSLLFQAPWIILSPGFWIAEFPLAFSFSLRGSSAVFWNYYSIPFVSFFWVFVSRSLKNKGRRWGLALVFLTLINGSESIYLNIPNARLFEFRKEAQSYWDQFDPGIQKGVVLARLLPFVDLKNVVSDRLPSSQKEKDQVDFYFLEKNVGNYNVPLDLITETIIGLRKADSGFLVVRETENLILFKRHGNYLKSQRL